MEDTFFDFLKTTPEEEERSAKLIQVWDLLESLGFSKQLIGTGLEAMRNAESLAKYEANIEDDKIRRNVEFGLQIEIVKVATRGTNVRKNPL